MSRIFSPQRLRARTPLTVTVVGTGVVAALLATMAFVSPGYSTQELDVDDASVWVVNNGRQMLGYANTELGELSTAKQTGSNTLGVIQAPGRMLTHDTASNTTEIYDPATLTVSATVPLPRVVPALVPGGEELMMVDRESGDMWSSRFDGLAAFDQKSAPIRNLGVDAVLAADSADRFVGYSTKSGQATIGNPEPDTIDETFDVAFTETDGVQVAMVAGAPVIYSPAAGEVWIDGERVSVADVVTNPDTALLMHSTVTGNRVLIAFDGGLVAVDLEGLHARQVTTGAGTPSTPLRVGTCEYAAWGDGSAYRNCGQDHTLTLDSAQGAELELAHNGQTVVATEPASGRTWAIQRDGERIDNWDAFVDESEIVQDKEDDHDVPPDLDKEQKPPDAVDDDLGVRGGRANRLPVLINDSDPNGDAIVIEEVSAVDESWGRIDLIRDAQELQITVAPEASGTATFTYVISDGHGNEDQAMVTLTVVGEEVNSAPAQVRPTRTSVASAGTARVATLDDWIDPESDPFYLDAASTALGDTVSYTPDGIVEFTDAGGGGGALKPVALSVSDGRDAGLGELAVTVKSLGEAPIIAENFAVSGYVGDEIRVEPLTEVRGGTGKITLNGANPALGFEELQLARDFEAGTFTVIAARPGTHFVTYSVTDEVGISADALVRVEVRPKPAEALAPVTVPTTAFLTLLDTQHVDVLANAYDPSGGVLSIVGVQPPPESGIVTEIVEQRILRVTLSTPLSGPVSFPYTVTNGAHSTDGTLTVIQVPEPAMLQPPVAEPDVATTRVGSVIDIPVLANDRQPNGKPLMLDPKLVSGVGKGGGTLAVSGDKLRYLAPDKPGEYSAVYKVSSSDGQYATAKVTVTVRDIDKANNRAPKPKNTVARVQAGSIVTIPIQLNGIDPDGDLVTLVGQASAPRLGSITEIGPSWLVYSAGQLDSGTDVFTYTVTDALGESATGEVRVGVVPMTDKAAPPIAMNDTVRTRPGTKLTVEVTSNDSDPEQSPLRVTAVQPTNDSVVAVPAGRSITMTAPTEPGNVGVLYTISNKYGLTSSAWLFVRVDLDAPLIAPIARDVQLSLEDIDGRTEVEADVLASASFTEGSLKDVRVTVPPETVDAKVTPSGKISVAIRPKGRIIPFTLARADDPSVSSTAFLWIPGSESAPPELRENAPKLTIPSGEKLTIKISDYVIAAGKKSVKLASADSVSATHSDGGTLVVNSSTLAYTSAASYWGPASITLTVTDGRNTATLNLPITVTAAKGQGPVMRSTTVPVEVEGHAELDLTMLTNYPYPDALSTLRYSVDKGKDGTVTTSISGTTLTIRAADGASPGQSATLTINVRDDKGTGTPGKITVTIVDSTRPKVVAVDDELTIRRGDSAKVDVLDNDSATNPFPGRPLRVISVGGGTTPGVRVSTSSDKRTVSISVTKDAPTGSLTLPYQVADSTNDPSRYATGTVTVKIQDVPEAPTGPPQIVSRNNDAGSVVVSIPSAYPNFAPITKYVVVDADGATVATCTNPNACTIGGLSYGHEYRFAAYAVNEVGQGKPSALSEPVTVDVVPNPPANVTLQPVVDDPAGSVSSLHATWSAPPAAANGTIVAGYEVTLSGPGMAATPIPVPVDVTSYTFTGGLVAGNSYTVSVAARNKTHRGDPGTASAHAVGPPSGVHAATIPTGDQGANVVVDGGDTGGGNALTFTITQEVGVAGQTCSVELTPNVTDGVRHFPDWQPSHQYVVRASNGYYCRTFIADGPLIPTITAGDASLTGPNGDLGAYDILVGGVASSMPSPIYRYRLSIDNGRSWLVNWTDLPGGNGGVLSHPSAYGRDTLVQLQACTTANLATCSQPHRAGNLTPVRTKTLELSCSLRGQPAVTPGPQNNGLASTIEVRYFGIVDGSRTAIGGWQPAAHDAPAAPAGAGSLQAEWRFTTNGLVNTDVPPTTCT